MRYQKYEVIPVKVKYLLLRSIRSRINGEVKPKPKPIIPVTHRHIFFQVVADHRGNPINGMVIKFTAVRSGRWSDSRDTSEDMGAKQRGIDEASIRRELTRMTSTEFVSQIFGVLDSDPVTKKEYAEAIGATLVPYTEEDEEGNMVEKTRVEGGLLAAIEEQKKRTRRTLMWNAANNK